MIFINNKYDIKAVFCSAFFVLSIIIFLLNIQKGIQKIDPYSIPEYYKLHSESGTVVINKPSTRELMKVGIALALKSNKTTRYFSCGAFDIQTCTVGFTPKQFSQDIIDVNATIKWYEYMNRKLIYEISIGNKTIETYIDTSNRYTNEINRNTIESKKAKHNLTYALISLILGFIFMMLAMPTKKNDNKLS